MHTKYISIGNTPPIHERGVLEEQVEVELSSDNKELHDHIMTALREQRAERFWQYAGEIIQR